MEKSFETSEPIRLDLRIPGGRIEVAAAETTTTEVRLDGPEELLARATIELRGDRLLVEVRDRKGLFVSFGRRDLTLTVRCPSGSSLAARTKSADVSATGRLAGVTTATASGDVSLERCEYGSAQSASGDVRVGEATGEISVQTASGDVEVARVGSVVVQGVSGDVRVGEASGPVRVSCVSGDVRLEAMTVGKVEVESVSGDVEVGIRRGSRVHVDASTLSGSTRSELELGGEPVGGDGPLVELRVKTVSGDIAVVRAAAPVHAPAAQEVAS